MNGKRFGTRLYAGIDVGGTKIQTCLVKECGGIVARDRTPTPQEEPAEATLDAVEAAITGLLKANDLEGPDLAAIGIAVPGVVDPKKGRVVITPNMNLSGVQVVARLEARFGVPVALGNDTNCGTLGEKWLGAARGASSVFGMFVGTGVGGGFVEKKKVWRGYRHAAAEIGHIVMAIDGPECGCGNRGCLEAYASATAVVERFRVEAGVSDLAHDPNLDCKAIFDAAYEGGDRAAARIVRETAEYLAVGITNILHALNPEMVVLTGGMMGAGERYLDEVRRAVGEIAFTQTRAGCTIQASVLGGDAGVIGTALAAEVFDRTGQLA